MKTPLVARHAFRTVLTAAPRPHVLVSLLPRAGAAAGAALSLALLLTAASFPAPLPFVLIALLGVAALTAWRLEPALIALRSWFPLPASPGGRGRRPPPGPRCWRWRSSPAGSAGARVSRSTPDRSGRTDRGRRDGGDRLARGGHHPGAVAADRRAAVAGLVAAPTAMAISCWRAVAMRWTPPCGSSRRWCSSTSPPSSPSDRRPRRDGWPRRSRPAPPRLPRSMSGRCGTRRRRRPSACPAFARELLTARVSAHYADPNAAGSYFVMVLPVAVGLALEPRARWWWAAAAAAIAAGLWISGSRTAMMAGLVAMVLPIAARGRRLARARHSPPCRHRRRCWRWWLPPPRPPTCCRTAPRSARPTTPCACGMSSRVPRYGCWRPRRCSGSASATSSTSRDSSCPRSSWRCSRRRRARTRTTTTCRCSPSSGSPASPPTGGWHGSPDAGRRGCSATPQARRRGNGESPSALPRSRSPVSADTRC